MLLKNLMQAIAFVYNPYGCIKAKRLVQWMGHNNLCRVSLLHSQNFILYLFLVYLLQLQIKLTQYTEK
jgi:hypothetical protein